MQHFFAQWPSGRSVKWRSLTWAEFKKYESLLLYNRPVDVYCDIYRTVVLEGPLLEDDPTSVAPAGIVEWVAKSLINNNPFGGSYEEVCYALDLKRGELKANYLLAAKAVIASIFRYTMEEIDQWDAEDFFERLAQAEYVTGRSLNPGNPERKTKTRTHKKQLTSAQEQVIEQVQRRNESNDSDPEAPKPKRKLSPAQQMVLDRVRKR